VTQGVLAVRRWPRHAAAHDAVALSFSKGEKEGAVVFALGDERRGLDGNGSSSSAGSLPGPSGIGRPTLELSGRG